MFNRRNAGLLGAMTVLAVACSGGGATPAPASHAATTAPASQAATAAPASHAAPSASAAAPSASAAAPSASAAAPSGSAAAPSGSAPAPSGSAAAGACSVAVSWNNFQQPRWAAHDKPNIQQAVEAGGGTYTDIDANNSTDTQLSQIQTLIDQHINVLILLAADTTALANSDALANLKAAGIPVIAYDRLLESPD